MNWITKKIIQSKLSQYFNNLNEEDIEISLLNNHHIKLKNMSLKTSLFASEDEFLIPTECRVGYLELEFDFSRLEETPLSIKVTSANIILKINETMKEQKPANDTKVITEYEKFLRMKEDFNYKSYFQRKKEQLKDWLIGILAEKTSLFIKDIEVAIEYPLQGRTHYIGITLEDVNIKSRTIINEQSINNEEKFVQLTGLDMFVGIENEVNLIKKQGENRETWVLKRSINKLSFLRHCQLSFRLNLFDRIIEAEIQNFIMNTSPTALKQIMQFSRYFIPLLNRTRPRIKPGEGPKKKCGQRLMTEGSAEWWKYLSHRVMELISKRRRYNILLNPSYRKYLFCLLLHIVYGDKHPEVADQIYSFEVNRPILEILKARQYLIERITSIEMGIQSERIENIGFVKLISSFKKQGYLSSRLIKYSDIEKSKRWNVDNGKNYIRKLEIQSLFKFRVKVVCKKMSIFACENSLLYDFVKLNKIEKLNQAVYNKELRDEYIRKVGGNFLKHALNELNQGFKKDQFISEWTLKGIAKSPNVIALLEVNDILAEMETNSTIQVTVASVKMQDLNKAVYSPQVLIIRNIAFVQTLQSREMRLANLDQQNAKISVDVEHISLTAQKPFLEKIIFLMGLVQLDIAAMETVTQFQKTMREALYQNMSRNQKKGAGNDVAVVFRKFTVMIPCDYSTKGDILGLQLLGINVGLHKNMYFAEVFSVRLALVNSFMWKDEKSFSLMSNQEEKRKESVILNLGKMNIENKNVFNHNSKGGEKPGSKIFSVTQLILPLIYIEVSIKELFLISYLLTLWKTTHFTPLSSLYVRSPLKRRKNHQYLSANESHLINNITHRMSVNIRGVAISFISLKKEREEYLFCIFLNNIELGMTQRSFSSQTDLKISEMYVENISNHLPINKDILERFTNSLLKEGDRLKKNKNGNVIDSLNMMLESDASCISKKESFNLKSSSLAMVFDDEDPEQILNAFEFREGEKNYLNKKLVLMNEGEKFLKVVMTDFYNLELHQQEEQIKVTLHPFHIIFEIIFFSNLSLLLDFTGRFSAKKLENFYHFMKDKGIMPLRKKNEDDRLSYLLEENDEEKFLIEDEKVIIDAKLSKYTHIEVHIFKVVLMLFHHNTVVYCLRLGDIMGHIKEQYLFTDMDFSLTAMDIVDTKPDAGRVQEILSLKGEDASVKIHIRSYKNQTLIRRHNCKSSLDVKIKGAEVNFLKKKVIELVDIIRYFVKELNHNDKEKPSRTRDQTESHPPAPDGPGLHYVVELSNTKVFLLQNSIEEKFVIGIVDSVVISNTHSDDQVRMEKNVSKNQDVFEECSAIDEVAEQFVSFNNDKEEESNKRLIYIDIRSLQVFGQLDQLHIEPILSMDQAILEINTVNEVRIVIEIAGVAGSINQEQFTFIMWMIDENFDEVANTLLPPGPKSEALGIAVLINVQDVQLSLKIPNYDIRVDSRGLNVKVFMYDNNRKEIRVGMIDINVANVVKEEAKVFLRSFTTDEPITVIHEKSFKSGVVVMQEHKKYEVQKAFDMNDIIKEQTKVEHGEEVHSLRMSMLEGRDKFDSARYGERDHVTNYEKLAKWCGRFCCKCFGRNYVHKKREQCYEEEIRSNERLNEPKDLDLGIPLKPHNENSVRNASTFQGEFIEDSRLIIKRKCFPSNVFDSMEEVKEEFLKVFMEGDPSGEKVKKVRVENLGVNIEQHSTIMALVQFFSYPFLVPNNKIKHNMKFNRFPPNTLELQLNNIRFVIGRDLEDYLYNSIEVLMNLSFSMQDEGDIKFGPGESKWEVNTALNVNYCKGNKDNNYIPISLCKDAKLIYTKSVKVPYFRNVDQIFEKREHIFLGGKDNQIHFKFPLTELKIIRKLVKKLKESNNNDNATKLPEIKEPPLIFNWVHEELKGMIPCITIELQRGLARALVEVTLSNMYIESEGVKFKDKEHQHKTTAIGTISGNYVNMTTGFVEPFIESWTFEAKTEESLKESQLVKLIKLASKGDQDSQGTNCLNINITTSLLKNLKDAESRYKNEGVVLDDCFINMLERKEQNVQINEGEQDDLITKYRLTGVDHRNFFGKKFVRLRGGKSLSSDNQKYWNLILEPYIMFHSFLDQTTGRKLVHLRTPLSINNICGTPVTLDFNLKKKASKDEWTEVLKNRESYCIPLNVYNCDYLVTVTLENNPKGKAVSLLAILKEYEQRSEFEEIHDWHPLYDKAFRLLEGNPQKWISKKDTFLKAGKNILLAACVKIKYQLQRSGFYNQDEKTEDVYETQVVLIPPLIIKNQLSMKLEMFVDDQSMVIEANSEKLMIDLPQNLLAVEIYFKKVTSSKRFRIFTQEEPISVYKIHISEGYNINMKCVRMSQMGRYLVIYSNYIIKNFTQENFEIFHKGNKILLERSFWFFITEDEDMHLYTKFSEINFYKGTGSLEKFDTNLKKQKIRLTKVMTMDEIAPLRIRLEDDALMLPGDEEDYQEESGGISKCCRKKKDKPSINPHSKVYDFVMWIKDHHGEISKTLCIYYKYEVKNNTQDSLILYHEDVEVFTLQPGVRRYLFQYESESQRFRVGFMLKNGLMGYSRAFKVDQPQDFMVKIGNNTDKVYPYDRNHLIRTIISQQEDLFLIEFNVAPPKEDFMMYLENSTMHNARIKETDEDFNLPPKERIPFFWSNLNFAKSNVIYVEIEGHSKEFIMNKLDYFEPLVLEEVNNQPPIMGITYKKGFLKVNYNQLLGEYLCVCDVLRQSFIIFQRSGTEYKKKEDVRLLQAAYMNTDGRNIYIYLPNGTRMTLMAPSHEEYISWKEVINNSLTVRAFHKIMLRMESTEATRILKLYEIKGDESKTVKRIEYSVAIDSMAVTLINSVPKEILLLGCDKLKLFRSEQFRSNSEDNLVRIKYENILQIGKIKLNNNIEDSEHPVIQAGSKRSDNPYFEIKAVRTYYRNFTEQENKHIHLVESKDEQINHYNTVRIFLDETEIVIDNVNYAEIKKIVEEVNRMIELYSIHDVEKKEENDYDIRQSPEYLRYAHDKGLYINELTIEPMKIILSAHWTSSHKEMGTTTHLAILQAMPFGIDHAVIQLKLFETFHINENTDILLNRLKRHYTQDIVVQILRNAGSYDLFVPLKIIGGVSGGAREIFYEPIYTLFTKRDIKSSSSKVLEGCVGFITTIVEVLFKFIMVIFKIMAFLTFDTGYNAKRNALMRRTMKSPRFALIHAGIYYLKLWPSVITGFYYRPKQEYQTRGSIGVPFGIFSAFMGVLKPLIGIYDLLYCLWFGFVNMATYEEEPMKFRTRPVRIFKNQLVKPYNRYEALAHEVMHRNKIDEIKNEFVQFAEEIQIKGRAVFIIITNYRLITSKETYSYNSIKFYKIKEIRREASTIHIDLNIADLVSCCICFTRKKRSFKYVFDRLEKAQLVEERLKDAINKNSQDPLEKSQVMHDVLPIRSSQGTNQ